MPRSFFQRGDLGLQEHSVSFDRDTKPIRLGNVLFSTPDGLPQIRIVIFELLFIDSKSIDNHRGRHIGIQCNDWEH